MEWRGDRGGYALAFPVLLSFIGLLYMMGGNAVDYNDYCILYSADLRCVVKNNRAIHSRMFGKFSINNTEVTGAIPIKLE